MSELEALYLTDNALRELPRSVGRLRRLRKLQAASNCLEALPDELALLPELVRSLISGFAFCFLVRGRGLTLTPIRFSYAL